MRKRYLLWGLLSFSSFCFSVQAQTIVTVNAGTDLFISSGTPFSAAGLGLTPSASFIINGNSIEQAETVTTFTHNNYVKPVYRFTAPTAPFSGTVRLQYSDVSLNGLSEASLRINLSNGSRWTAASSASNDIAGNTVISIPVDGEVLREMALADAANALPLRWGAITVTTEGTAHLVKWTTYAESNVSHFDVERSNDSRNWTTIVAGIAAQNSATTQHYTATDKWPLAGRQWYRVRQADRDGQQTYSLPVLVTGPSAARLSLYPNPVIQNFSLQGGSTTIVKGVQLYNASGVLVKAWPGWQQQYLLTALPAGTYYLSVSMANGETQQLSFIRK